MLVIENKFAFMKLHAIVKIEIDKTKSPPSAATLDEQSKSIFVRYIWVKRHNLPLILLLKHIMRRPFNSRLGFGGSIMILALMAVSFILVFITGKISLLLFPLGVLFADMFLRLRTMK